MKQERSRKLTKDVLIYGVGNIGSRFMAFLMIPILSFFIRPGEIGYYDVALTNILFLLPITTLQMREAIFRLLVDNDDAVYRKGVISTAFFIEGVVFGVILLASLVIPVFMEIRAYGWIVLSIYAYSFYELYLYVARVMYSSMLFALMSVMTSVLTVAFTFWLMFAFDMGIEALFIGNIVSRIASVIIIEAPRRRFLQSLSVKHVNRNLAGEIFKYALPILVSSIVFGVIVTSGKNVVQHLCGYDVNGSLAVAEKYASIIVIAGVSFYQAWQETAVRLFNRAGEQAFFSSVFNRYSLLLSLLVLCVAFGVRLFSPLLIRDGYGGSLDILFIYGAGLVFFCLSNFYEVIFQCTKQTSKLIYPVLICAAVSPAIFFALVKLYGLTGYAITLGIAYLYLFIHRYFQTRKICPVKLGGDFGLSMLLIAAGGAVYFIHNRYADCAVLFTAVVWLLFIARKLRMRRGVRRGEVAKDTFVS